MRPSPSTRIKGLYAITPDEPDTALLLYKSRLALSGGARVLQYRNKVAGASPTREQAALRLVQARALRELTKEFSVTLIVNDDAVLAQQVGADGVHLGGEDGSIATSREALGSDKLIGVSCYNRAAMAFEAVRQGADYVAFGSFFPSTVKPDAVAASTELLRLVRREIAVPLVAIGGITVHNGPQLLEAGADALAVISALFSAADIQDAARQFSRLNYAK
jgi:thiamine-phosphate pyrophosphorylase